MSEQEYIWYLEQKIEKIGAAIDQALDTDVPQEKPSVYYHNVLQAIRRLINEN